MFSSVVAMILLSFEDDDMGDLQYLKDAARIVTGWNGHFIGPCSFGLGSTRMRS
jgi:hypothetical protein